MRALVFIIVAAGSLATAGAAWACSCVEWQSAERQLAAHKVAFIGQAVSTVPAPGQAGRDGYVVTRFLVRRTLRGPHRTFRSIFHVPGPGGAVCEISFEVDRETVVLAYIDEGRLGTSMCSAPQFPIADFESAARQRSRPQSAPAVSAAIWRRACSNTSAGWPPEISHLFSTTTAGTELMPRLSQSFSSARTASA